MEEEGPRRPGPQPAAWRPRAPGRQPRLLPRPRARADALVGPWLIRLLFSLFPPSLYEFSVMGASRSSRALIPGHAA